MDESGIRALEAQRYAAMGAGDLATLDRLFSEELVYTHSNAVSDTKAEYLEKMRSGALRYIRTDHSVEKVVMNGDAALAFGRMTATVVVDGNQRDIGSLALAVWLRQGDAWRLAAYQPTPLPKK